MIKFTQTGDLKLEGTTTVKGDTVFHINSKGKQILELRNQNLRLEGEAIYLIKSIIKPKSNSKGKKEKVTDDNSSIIKKDKITDDNSTTVKKAKKNIDIGFKTVKIGNQVWMSENLKVEFYRNGDPIPCANDWTAWENFSKNETGCWGYYEFNEDNNKKYGKLYNWYAVNDPRGLAPVGFRISTINDWEKLKKFCRLGSNAEILKKSTGFALVFGGWLLHENAEFIGMGTESDFWNSDDFTPKYYDDEPEDGDSESIRHNTVINENLDIDISYIHAMIACSVRCLES